MPPDTAEIAAGTMTVKLNNTYEMVAHFQQLAEHDKTLLARELHDELGGLLIGAVMDLGLLAPRIASLDDDFQQRIGRVRHALGGAIELTRRITEELHPTLLDNVGLFAASRWLLKNACVRTHVKCIDNLPEREPSLTSRASIALFRTVQEAVLVGLERPQVTEVNLIGKLDDDELSFKIEGDGERVPDDPNDLANLTLESIRHRIRALGGTVIVESPPQGGVLLVMSTPLANVASDQGESREPQLRSRASE
jgi:signal transduction histidine kinase